MDIICGKCGKHFSSVEGAREHGGQCEKTSAGEAIHWKPAKQSSLTDDEWGALMRLINTVGKAAPKKSAASKNRKKKVSRQDWQDMVRLINSKDKKAPGESAEP